MRVEESRTKVDEPSVEFGRVGRIVEYVVTRSTGEDVAR